MSVSINPNPCKIKKKKKKKKLVEIVTSALWDKNVEYNITQLSRFLERLCLKISLFTGYEIMT
jgi:hypothetical protein